MSERKIQKPIIIVGAPRSGTTLLARIFAAHPEVAFWEEPRTIWEIGNSLRHDDGLAEKDLSPSIARKIDRQFGRFLKKSGKSRFAEKTPTNSLRLKFVHALYPDAKIIHIVRDGRASVTSILKMRNRPARPDRVWTRLRETPISGYPALIARALKKRRFLLRPAGWEDFSDDPVEATVQLWKAITANARRDLDSLPADLWIEFQYEDFIKNHPPYLEKMRQFCELKDSREFSEKADELIDPTRAEVEISPEAEAAFQKFGENDSIGSSRVESMTQQG